MQNSYTNKSLHISPQYICFDISKHSSLAYSQGYTDCLAYAFMVFTFSVLLWPCSLVLLFILQSFILICILVVHVSRFVLIVLYFCVVSYFIFFMIVYSWFSIVILVRHLFLSFVLILIHSLVFIHLLHSLHLLFALQSCFSIYVLYFCFLFLFYFLLVLPSVSSITFFFVPQVQPLFFTVYPCSSLLILISFSLHFLYSQSPSLPSVHAIIASILVVNKASCGKSSPGSYFLGVPFVSLNEGYF